MMYRYWFINLLLGMSVCMVSCHDEQYDASASDRTLIEVPITCKIASQRLLENDNVLSRAAQTLPEDVVSNLWVFQFDGTSENSILVGDPLYFELKGTGKDIVKISSSGSTVNRLVFVANNNDPNYAWRLLSGTATYANLIAKTKEITATSFPDTDVNLPLVAEWNGPINSSQISSGFDLTFAYSVAKIEFDLQLSDALEEGFNIRSVQLKQIPAQMRWCDALVKMTDETTVFPGTTYGIINYEAITDRLPTKEQSQKYVWYIPRNHQGVSSNTTANQKNSGAKATATYIEILAVDKDKNDIRFRLYPGENMLNNFNITSNTIYKLPLTISGAGDPETDSRVEHLSKVVFPKSNCYILNPPDAGSGAKVFYIPIERVNDFWTDPAYEIIGQDFKLAFTEETYWKCEVIWNDNNTLYSPSSADESNRLTITKASGQGISDQYLQVRLPAITASQHGNIVIGMYRTDETGTIQGGCAWSWHLWITDYNPDIPVTPTSQLFTYPVPGGQVERYGGKASGYPKNVDYSSWTSTPSFEQPYAGKLVMDRYLGVRSDALQTPNYPDENDNYLLYSNPTPMYQYGRKDPIPTIGRYAIYDKNNTVVYTKPTDNKGNNNVRNNRFYKNYCGGSKMHPTGGITMRTAIEEPDKFCFYGGSPYWLIRTDETSPTIGMGTFRQYIWNDLKIPAKSMLKNKKSLFDPCPPGWKIPISEMWNNEFTITDGSTNSGNARPKLNKLMNGYMGLRYWPDIYMGTERPVDGSIFYPIWYSFTNTGTISNFDTGLAIACADQFRFFINDKIVSSTNPLATTLPIISNVSDRINQAYVVRCVQE